MSETSSGRLWLVRLGNSYPMAVDSLWPTEQQARRRLNALMEDGRPWCIEWVDLVQPVDSPGAEAFLSALDEDEE